jgi:hypothetical protein
MKGKPGRIAVTLSPSFLRSVDDWRRKQRDHPSRAVAIRRLAERGLASSTTLPRKETRRKAAEMADREIERLGDQGVNNEELVRRKRRLIEGPREFRDIRSDLAKTKS